jgi:hypothetical protein
MDCLEIIALRSSTIPDPEDLIRLVKHIEASHGAEETIALRFFQHATVENDFSVHIRRKTTGGRPDKSALGLQLAHLFSEFGLVSHSVWIEG